MVKSFLFDIFIEKMPNTNNMVGKYPVITLCGSTRFKSNSLRPRSGPARE